MIDYKSAIATEDIENLSLCIVYMKENDENLYVKNFDKKHMVSHYRFDTFFGHFAMLDNPIIFETEDHKVKQGEYCRVALVSIVPHRI